jgi:NhaP-type Na+/H+ or K+/H+ antiporter
VTAARRALFPTLAAIALAGAGWAAFALLGWQDAASNAWFATGAALLLIIGLYASTYPIDITSLHQVGSTVLLAVTVGVAAKAALICAVMFAVTGDARTAVLGIAVAQIDPLSVAAIRRRSRLSRRGDALLRAWAAFDDPVTAVATALVTLAFLDRSQAVTAQSEWVTFLVVLAGTAVVNVLVTAAVYVLWRALATRGTARPAGRQRAVTVAMYGGLLAATVIAVWRLATLSAALIGLFYRPAFSKFLARLTTFAYWCAVAALGGLLVRGIDIPLGILLGVSAYVAQALAAFCLTRRESPDDRLLLALAQQNGITAIVLALFLESVIGGAAAVIAPAVLTANLLHVVANHLASRRLPGSRVIGLDGRTSPTGDEVDVRVPHPEDVAAGWSGHGDAITAESATRLPARR